MNTNGTHPTPDTAPHPDRPDRPDPPERLPGEIWLDLDAESRAGLEDVRWINEQYNRGAFDEYTGEWIAVVRKTLLGHDKSLMRLREAVSATHGIPVSRIVTTYINRHQIPSI